MVHSCHGDIPSHTCGCHMHTAVHRPLYTATGAQHTLGDSCCGHTGTAEHWSARKVNKGQRGMADYTCADHMPTPDHTPGHTTTHLLHSASSVACSDDSDSTYVPSVGTADRGLHVD